MNDKPMNTESGGRMNDKPMKAEHGGRMSNKPMNTESGGRMNDKPMKAEHGGRMNDKPMNTEPDGRMSNKPMNTEPDGRMNDKPMKAEADGRMSDKPTKAEADVRMSNKPNKAETDAAPAPEQEPASPRQHELDTVVLLLEQDVHEQAVTESYVNQLNGDMPTIIIDSEHWLAAAKRLKSHEQLDFDYLRNVSGVDYETHLEVVYHFISLKSRRELSIKVKTERERPSIASVTSVWATANWNEREIYDLLGVDFPGHPDLRRIMMPDDWEGYPLRKDYEPLDPEV